MIKNHKSIFLIFFGVALCFLIMPLAGASTNEINLNDNRSPFTKNLTILIVDDNANAKLIFKNFPMSTYIETDPSNLINGINETFKGKATDMLLEFNNLDIIATFNLDGHLNSNDDKFVFSLNKINSTLGFSEWAILYFDELSIILPEDATLLNLTPAPDRTNKNYFTWDLYNWNADIAVTFSNDTRLSGISPQIGTKRRSALLRDVRTESKIASGASDATIAGTSLPMNTYSNFSKPGIEVYTGSDVVSGHTAQEWAEKYKPYFIYDVDRPDYCYTGSDSTTHPASFHYRVLKGADPHANGITSILIQYYVYWANQPYPPHNYDYEPVWVWVDNFGSRPYRVVFSDWDPTDGKLRDGFHVTSVFRTHWFDAENNGFHDYSHTTESKAWFPFGIESSTHQIRLEDVTSLEFDTTTHVWLRVPHAWHTFSADLDCGIIDQCDEGEKWYCPSGTTGPPGTTASCIHDITPSALGDNALKDWYKRFDSRNCRQIDVCWIGNKNEPEYQPYMDDISDSFNDPVYWGRSACDNSPNPAVNIISLTYSVSGNNLIATATVKDEQSDPIQGLWPDRFYGYLDSVPLTRLSRTETSAGIYDITFDISGKSPSTYTFDLYVYDNLDKYDTATTSVNIPGDSQPPNPPGLSSPSNGYTTSDNTPAFSWTAPTDPGGSGIASYRIQVDDDSGFGSPEIDASPVYSTSYTAPFALPDGKYYWHVLAVDNNGNIGDYSGTWSFTVDTSCVDTSDPPAPSSISVPSSDSDGVYTASWSSVVDVGCSGISHYELKEQGPSGTRYIDTYDTSMDIVVNENGVYTYWARAWDNAGNYGGWSPAGSVTVNIPPADPDSIDGFNTDNGRVTIHRF